MTEIQKELRKFLDLSPDFMSSKKLLLQEIDSRRRTIRRCETEIKEIKSLLYKITEDKLNE